MSFTEIYDLPEIKFIAGTTQTLTFNVYDSGSAAVNLNASTATWTMAAYGQSEALITKSGSLVASPNNQVVFMLDPADTIDLNSGQKFLQQYTVTAFDGSVSKPSQGLITIFPAIQ
jgi:hypothetical protein